ncbi:MAG: hypothetical protein V2G48_00490 [bacterium JZ-2024 1]
MKGVSYVLAAYMVGFGGLILFFSYLLFRFQKIFAQFSSSTGKKGSSW